MKMTIENIPSYKLAYMRQVGPYGKSNGETMEKLKNWAKVNGLFHDKSIIVGIAWDNPETTEAKNCRYDAGMVMADDYPLHDQDVSRGNIQGGSYAVFTIDHTAEAVQKGWTDIFPELIRQGYHFDETRPVLERYRAEMICNHCCEICVPIRS